jgi:ribonuclease J
MNEYNILHTEGITLMNQPSKQYTVKRKRSPHQGNGVRIFALGGLDEIGKNMYGIEYGNEIIVIDAGIKFPSSDMPGVDYIIPNTAYLVQNREKVKGIFLTHGHEDHIGGLPFVLRQIEAPIYGAALTIGLVRSKLEEHGLLQRTQLNVFDETSTIQLNQMSLRFFRTFHSIPDAFGIVVHTPEGNIVHTGDFKFDMTPVEKPADLISMAEIGQQGVLALMADSTNSEKSGFTPSEREVGAAILDSFHACRGRILFATFASNVHRLQQVVDAAMACGRRIAIIGRSMEKVFRIGQDLGYIRLPHGMLIDVKHIDRFSEHEIVIICTGSQGETNAALTRIANGSHTHVQIYPNDTVIFSSSPIPGNTKNVNRSIDLLFRAGAHVVYGSILDIHTSGHGCQEDLKLMLNIMKPTYLIPIHGEHRMLVQHSRLAQAVGIPSENIFVMDNGQTLRVSRKQALRGKNIPTGNVLVKGNLMSEQENIVMEDRKLLSESGVMIVLLVVDMSTGKLVGGPNIISRGFVYVREAGDITDQALTIVKRICTRLSNKGIPAGPVWKQAISQAVTNHYESSMDRSPLIMPILMEV